MPIEFFIGSKNFIGSLYKKKVIFSNISLMFKSNVQPYECLISFAFLLFSLSNSGLLDNHTAKEEISSSSGHSCNHLSWFK